MTAPSMWRVAVELGLLKAGAAERASATPPERWVGEGWIEAADFRLLQDLWSRIERLQTDRNRTDLARAVMNLVSQDSSLTLDDALARVRGEPRDRAGEIVFGRYRILQRIGSGGMGVVYRVEDTKLGRVVALKGIATTDREAIERFAREAAAAARLNHPNIVPVYDVGQQDDHFYLTMQLIEGRSLQVLLQEPGMPRRFLLEALVQVAEALEHAHRQGILHRDVKPANILIEPAGRAYVADFGLAKFAKGDSKLTASGVVLGTPPYMAPEQARGLNREIDARTDVYGLGATLYEILTGQPPAGGAETYEILRRVVNEEPARPSSLDARVARDLETICMKALEKEKARRYGSAGEFAADLRRFLDGEPVRARPVSGLERARRWIRRHRLATGAAAAVAAALLFGLYTRLGPGRAHLQTDPPGARVYVDDAFAGTTPLTTRLLWPGLRKVRVETPDHEPLDGTVQVVAGQTVSWSGRLRHEQGWLKLTSALDAMTVTVRHPDGRRVLVSAAPVDRLPLETGPYVLECARENSHPREFRTTVFRDRETHEHLTLPPAERWTLALPGRPLAELFAADFDRDGWLDVAVPVAGRGLFLVSGRSGRPLAEVPSANPRCATAADVDGDGAEDLIVLQVQGGLQALSWKDGRVLWRSDCAGRPAVRDLDGDGRGELIVIDAAAIHALELPTARKRWSAPLRCASLLPAFGDCDGDGVLDVVCVGADRHLRALSGVDGRELWRFDTGDAEPRPPVVLDADGDGVPEVAVGGPCTCLVSGRDGRLRWKFPFIGDSLCAADLTGDGRPEVLTTGAGNRLTALDAVSGKPLWTVDQVPSWSAPRVADLDGDGRPEVISGSNGLSIASHDGARLWRYRLAGPVMTIPLVVDIEGDGVPEIVFGADDGSLVALRGSGRDLLWSCRVAETAWLPEGVPRIDGGRVFLSADRFVASLDARTGRPLWSRPLSNAIRSPVERRGDLILAPSKPNVFAAIDAETGRLRWERADLPGDDVSPVLALSPDVAIVGVGTVGPSRLVAFDPATGRERWTASVPFRVWSKPAAGDLDGDGRPDVVVRSGQEIFALRGTDGGILWRRAPGRGVDGSPLVADFDGDGRPEVAVTRPRGVRFLRGTDGSEIWAHETAAESDWQAAAADLDGDGRSEVVFGAHDGAILAASLSRRECRTLANAGVAVESSAPCLADFDGDGAADVAAATRDGYILVFSGRSGRLLRCHAAGVTMTNATPVAGDLDGDGRPELAAVTRDGIARAWRVVPRRGPAPFWGRADIRSQAEAVRKMGR